MFFVKNAATSSHLVHVQVQLQSAVLSQRW